MSDGRFYFVDADDGRILYTTDAFKSQSAVGVGSGFRGQRRKLSTVRTGTRFEATDRLRSAEIVTIDLRFNVDRYVRLLFEYFEAGLPPGVPVWNADDVASDADNDWNDVAVVEAHACTGWTYDYLYSRHGWQGLDGANGTHPQYRQRRSRRRCRAGAGGRGRSTRCDRCGADRHRASGAAGRTGRRRP